MCRHRRRNRARGTKRREIRAGQDLQRLTHHRQGQMAVDARATVPRDVLHDRHHATGHEALGDGPTQRTDTLRIVAEGAIADDAVGASDGDVENGRAVGVDAERAQILSQQVGHQERCPASPRRVPPVHVSIGGSGRQRAPEWWSQTLHAPAFLVDRHQHVVGADRLACRADKAADLVGGLAVAGEEDEACRTRAGQERCLVRGQLGPR